MSLDESICSLRKLIWAPTEPKLGAGPKFLSASIMMPLQLLRYVFFGFLGIFSVFKKPRVGSDFMLGYSPAGGRAFVLELTSRVTLDTI